MSHRRAVSAFTLIEVAFSVGIIAVGILTIALFMPVALRAHQQARYQLYGGTMAMELIERFMATQTANDYHPEANQPWDTPSGYRSMSPDLEIKSSTLNAGFIPIPRDIAYRLDSPNDEIRTLLDQGGNVFYSNPRIVAVGARDGTTAKPLSPIDSQRMVIGIVGGAQQNALPCLPMKAWPYRAAYPSQPQGLVSAPTAPHWDTSRTHSTAALCAEQAMSGDPDMFELLNHDFSDFRRSQAGNQDEVTITSDWDGFALVPSSLPASTTAASVSTAAGGSLSGTPWPGIRNGSGYLATSGYMQDFEENVERPLTDLARTGGANGIPGWVTAKGYVALALWYAQRKGLPASFILGRPTREEIDRAAATPAHVHALRFLAHAGMCLTKHYSLEARPRLEEQQNIPGYNTHCIDGQPIGAPDHWEVRMNNITLLKTPAHPGLRLGIPIPGDDRWDPAIPTSVNEPGMVQGRMGIPSPFSLQALWSFGSEPLATATVDAAILNWSVVDPAHPYKQPGNPDFDATRWVGHSFVTHDMIVNWHETCLKVVMQYAADNPYDWSAPRPLNRALSMDHPLIQWDLFPTNALPKLSGVIALTAGDANVPVSDPSTPDYQYVNGVVASQWRPVAARTITNGMPVPPGTIGMNGDIDYGNGLPVDWSAISGDPLHFNLTNRFAAAERCREIVVWTADWMSYVDCETAPSAPVDASRYPRPRPGAGKSRWVGPVPNTFTNACMYGNDQPSFQDLSFSDRDQPSFRNPEAFLLFIKDMNYPDGSPAVPTNHDIFPWTVGPIMGHDHGANSEDLQRRKVFANMWLNDRRPPDMGYVTPKIGNYPNTPEVHGGPYNFQGQDPRPAIPIASPRMIFSGVFGGDRNCNNVLDRGPLPRSTKLHAVEVARFMYYDPRLVMSLR